MFIPSESGPAGAEIAWAAGLFEGEGSIGQGAENGSINLRVDMTDEDVVRRFHAVVGCGAVRGPIQRPGQSNTWIWSCSTLDSVRILDLFMPWLGERRTARARVALEMRELYIDISTRARRCANPRCERIFQPPYTKSAARKIYCSKRCAWAVHNQRRRAA